MEKIEVLKKKSQLLSESPSQLTMNLGEWFKPPG